VNAPQWDNLILDRSAVPTPIDDGQFRAWMSHHRIFVSSLMDGEMTPFRSAVRSWILEWDGHPVMWEEITPQDERPQTAFIYGVNQSDVFVLLLGTRYGIPDASGYSPTHQEANQAKVRGIPRLLFDREGLNPSERAGMLIDWLKSMYVEVSTGKFTDANDLVRRLERRLRELVSQQETTWLKLGPIVVPGTVRQVTSSGDTEFFISARVTDPTIQRALSDLGNYRSDVNPDRLTWGTRTFAVSLENVESNPISASTHEFVITCRFRPDRADSPMNFAVEDIDPAEQAEIWGRRALFGQAGIDRSYRAVDHHTAPEYEPLPNLLQRYGASGWLAEGMTRLYFVERILSKYEGSIERLDVGPATSSSVHIHALFRMSTHERRDVDIQGNVPIPNG
jgi:hypothetical protein